MDPTVFESDNINTLWLKNIFDNLKNIENISRLAKEGCTSIVEYAEIPLNNRAYFIGDTQYKNLRFLVTELSLLLDDLEVPIENKDELHKYKKSLDKISNIITNRKLFLKEPRDKDGNIISSTPNQFFYDTLDILQHLKVNIYNNISHILYIRKKENPGWQS